MNKRTIPLPCIHCGGEGRLWKSRYGGNDPDVWDAGPCEACHGTGDQTCEECSKHAATSIWRTHSHTWLVCDDCYADWVEDEAA
jgi:DnaJ-class molecular chaperone